MGEGEKKARRDQIKIPHEEDMSWSCEMCGRTLEESLQAKYPMLYQKNVVTASQYYERKREIYIRDRTRKCPKKTCCRSCGYNFSAWLRNQDSKKTYFRDSFTCLICRKNKTGGRVLKRGSESVMICRGCHRVRLTNDLRREWEILNHDNRLDYQRRYYSANKKRLNLRKRLWRAKIKAKGGSDRSGA